MNFKLLLILVSSISAFPQNFNGIIEYNNKVHSIEPNLYQGTFPTDNKGKVSSPGLNGLEAGKQYLLANYGYKEGIDYKVSNSYSSDNGLTHIYLKQLNKGLEVNNGNMNINVDKFGKVISVGGSFNKPIPSNNNSNTDSWGSPVNALFSLFDYLKVDPKVEKNEVNIQDGEDKDTFKLSNVKATYEDITTTKKYIQVGNGQFERVWAFYVDLGDHYWSAAVTPSGKVIELYDLVNSFK